MIPEPIYLIEINALMKTIAALFTQELISHLDFMI
jgi:hypothetical protein